MLEFPGPRASAIGYHGFYVIRQIGGNWVRKVDRLVRKTMAVDSPKAQISGGVAQCLGNALRTTRSTWMDLFVEGANIRRQSRKD
jgi:ABC-type phosphonate transport system ATPase subunit